ncbi:MAG: TrmB family transcriptional regulator [Candidatus Marinimicrobia bacterium]|nr:TrmB family transcriptional regulator [Candidatus Neomarinimicrobiota bacterium]MBT6870030.1 TrmB family transcriptional regulator [Candidatus Neomarinimicrobiota bacterium]
MEADVIVQLSQFGFSKNESKAYLSLLAQNPATGYEISQRSGVPRSAIYDIMKKMELSGVVSTIGNKPVQYIPISTDQLSQNLTSQFEHNIEELKKKMSELDTESSEGNVWNIKGYQAMIDHLRSVIDNAEESIFCSIWNREFDELLPQFTKAQERGVEIVNFSFSGLDESVGENFSYGIDEEKLKAIWQRQIIVLIDRKAVLLGNSNQSKDNQAIWTTNPAVLNISLNNIILDITLYSQRKKVDIDHILDKMMDKNMGKIENLL